ncbi:hypothetical protein B0O80DRAFT_445274 [Mortierella sp. GBAus27b]|nr:hypothetical protein B0O80DRAFT_445274 [Mortierella sp. GBAus27b]
MLMLPPLRPLVFLFLLLLLFVLLLLTCISRKVRQGILVSDQRAVVKKERVPLFVEQLVGQVWSTKAGSKGPS